MVSKATGMAATMPPFSASLIVTLSISVGLVYMGSPSWGESIPPAGAISHPKTVSRKYHVRPTPSPNAMNVPRTPKRILRANRLRVYVFAVVLRPRLSAVR